LTPAKRRALVSRLGYRVMNEIDHATSITPGSLVSAALLQFGKRGVPHEDLVATCERLARTLHHFGARFSPSLAHPGEAGRIRLEAIREACDLFIKAGHVQARLPGDTSRKSDRLDGAIPGAIYLVPDEARLSLDLAKNLLIHFFVSRGLVAIALLAPSSDGAAKVPLDSLRDRVQRLSKLFKHEFSFRADASFDEIFDQTLREMETDGEIAKDGAFVVVAEGGRAQVVLYARMLKNFVEAYRVAARALVTLLRGPATPKDLAKRALAVGKRMVLAGEIERSEAVCRPVLENAFQSFVDHAYLNRADGKLSLPESYASADAVAVVEAKIGRFLERRPE